MSFYYKIQILKAQIDHKTPGHQNSLISKTIQHSHLVNLKGNNFLHALIHYPAGKVKMLHSPWQYVRISCNIYIMSQ